MIDNTTISQSSFCLKCGCQLPSHYAECPELEPKYIANLECKLRAACEERDNLLGVLRRNGFVRCDIPACNCGSWHARYGLPERWEEVKEALAEAGHYLCNENGHLVSNALKALIEERDRYKNALNNEVGCWDGTAAHACEILINLRKRLEGK